MVCRAVRLGELTEEVRERDLSGGPAPATREEEGQTQPSWKPLGDSLAEEEGEELWRHTVLTQSGHTGTEMWPLDSVPWWSLGPARSFSRRNGENEGNSSYVSLRPV